MSIIEQNHLEIYLDLFVHRRDVYAQQTAKGAYFLQRRSVTGELIREHLEGHRTVGFYALASDNSTRWVVLDADRENGLEKLQHAWQALSARGLPSFLELSRRGGHLWTFFEPMSALVARRLILGAVPDLEGVEVFPKRDRLYTSKSAGNLVRRPLGVHQLSGQRYPFVDPISLRSASGSLEGTLDYLRGVPRVSVTQAAEQLATLLGETSRSPSPLTTDSPAKNSGVGASPIERLRQEVGDLYTFVSRYVELDADGRGHCPFHPPDLNPSFAVDRQGGYWICFHEVNPKTGRYLGGDAVAFYRRLKMLSYRETIKELNALLAAEDMQLAVAGDVA